MPESSPAMTTDRCWLGRSEGVPARNALPRLADIIFRALEFRTPWRRPLRRRGGVRMGLRPCLASGLWFRLGLGLLGAGGAAGAPQHRDPGVHEFSRGS